MLGNLRWRMGPRGAWGFHSGFPGTVLTPKVHRFSPFAWTLQQWWSYSQLHFAHHPGGNVWYLQGWTMWKKRIKFYFEDGEHRGLPRISKLCKIENITVLKCTGTYLNFPPEEPAMSSNPWKGSKSWFHCWHKHAQAQKWNRVGKVTSANFPSFSTVKQRLLTVGIAFKQRGLWGLTFCWMLKITAQRGENQFTCRGKKMKTRPKTSHLP